MLMRLEKIAKIIGLKAVLPCLASMLVWTIVGAASAPEPSAETCLQRGDQHVERHEHHLAIAQAKAQRFVLLLVLPRILEFLTVRGPRITAHEIKRL